MNFSLPEPELINFVSLDKQNVHPPDDTIQLLLLQGKKIEAIKLYREQTGLGLREAKEVIDDLEDFSL